MWEYKRKKYDFNSYSELNENLNIEGDDNWEIIHYFEEKPEKYGNKFIAHVLYKRLKLPA